MAPRTILLPMALVIACGDKDNNPNDADKDGFPYSEDCDETDPAVNPAATEVCDGIDNDCDGSTDEDDAADASLWYADLDGDGYGGDTLTRTACAQPADYYAEALDCDDSRADRSPESTWYIDADGDGYGDDDRTVQACEQPTGTASRGGDCDDTNAEANPAAAWYADDDGDGYGDPAEYEGACEEPEGYVSNSEDCDDTDADINPETLWHIDADGDGFGVAEATEAGCEPPEGSVGDGTDCDDEDERVYPKAKETCGDGVVNDCNSTWEEAEAECLWARTSKLADADLIFTASGDEQHTRVLTSAGDYNGDGADDLLLGSMWASTGTDSRNGAAFVFYGPVSPGTRKVVEADLTLEGGADNTYLGIDATSMGDLDGDGFDDLLLTAPGEEVSRDEGAAFLLYGPSTSIDAARGVVLGASQQELGTAVARVGDQTGDGVADFLVSAVGDDDDTGSVYLLSGATTGTAQLADHQQAQWVGEGPGAELGFQRTLAGVGDVDGDGNDDILLGSPAYSTTGRAYLFLGPATGTYELADADAVYADSGSTSVRLGQAVVGLGDHDGDGLADFALGAPAASTTSSDAGAVYIMAGANPPPATLGEYTGIIRGGGLGYMLGGDLSAPGDLTDDGITDLIVGSGRSVATPTAVRSTRGADTAWLYAGPLSGSLVTPETSFSEGSYTIGQRAASVGDLNGDGENDVGVLDAGTASSEAGSVSIFFTPEP